MKTSRLQWKGNIGGSLLINLLGLIFFKGVAGIEYTKEIITGQNLEWLRTLPLYHREGDMEFMHASASLVRPDKWYYLALGSSYEDSLYQDVRENFAVMKGNVCFVGHSHVPTAFVEVEPKKTKLVTPSSQCIRLGDKRAFIDVGSVGEPRTRSKKSSFVIYETESREVFYKRFSK